MKTRLAWVVLPLAFSACTKEVKLAPELQAKLDLAENLVRSDDKNKFAEAEKLFSEILAAEPRSEDAIVWKAQMLIAWADALHEEALLLAEAKEELAALVERAKAKAAAADTPEAKAFAQVLVTSIQVRHDKVAKTLEEWQRDAAEHQKRGLELVENRLEGRSEPSYKVHRVLADYYRVTGDLERARAELDAVRRLDPNSAGLHFVTGVMQLKVDKNHDAAIANMDKALAKDDGFIKALYTKGLALAEKGDKKGAEKVMHDVLAKSPNHLGAKTYLHIVNLVNQAALDLEREQPVEE